MEDTKRTIAKLRRQLVVAQNELATIQKAARAAETATASEKRDKLNRLKGMMPSLDRYYVKFEDSYNELVVLGEELHDLKFPTDQEKKESNLMRNAYYEIRAAFENLIQSPSESEPTRTSSLDATTIIHETSTNHLPEIKLEKFDGEILSWPKFRDTFVSIVHEDKNLSPTKKFHYLRTSVMGPALTMISKFQITDSNYSLAWNSLCEAYDKKRLLATAYLNQVLNFSPMHGKTSVESLKTFMVRVCDSISAFQLLNIADESQFILFHLAYRLLDSTTREQFQNAHKDTNFPTFDQLCTFVKDKCFTMQLSADTNVSFDNLPTSSRSPKEFHKGKSYDKRQLKKYSGHSSLVTNQSKPSLHQSKQNDSGSLCFVCRERPHGLLSCKMFCGADVKQRIAWLENWKGCKNCLSSRHELEYCKSKWVCRWCKQRHNSMICERMGSPSTSITSPTNIPGTCCAIPGTYTATKEELLHPQIMLGTCVAEVLDARGVYQTVRLVVDSASHYSFMTNKCANRLGLLPNKCNMVIGGIGENHEGIKGFVNCIIKPMNKSEPHLTMKALLLKTITSYLPTTSLPRSLWIKYVKFPLADPKFYESKPVDMLLGADLFGDLWLGSPIEIDSTSPKLFPTIFGHVVIGKFTNSSDSVQSKMGTSLISTSQVTISELNSNLVRFWDIEEPKSSNKSVDPEDQYCEDHFQMTHFRLEDGSYGVRLPFRSQPPEFTDIATISLRRFRNLENRLAKQDDLRGMYHDFIRQMEIMGHMTATSNPPAYIIPHHHVSKVDRNELKIRVVFHCSTQSKEGSLNDYLLVGPKLHTDIRDVLLNFRTHEVALVSDCVKMFRGIWVHPEDRKYQTIYWRFNPFDALQIFELNTLVYGAASSPFLANRIIRKIVEDHGMDYPEASKVLLRDIYVDDVVSGCRTIEQAKTLRHQLITLLDKGKLKLSKWASNVPELLNDISDTNKNEPITLISKDDTSIKILGLQWNPQTDCFGYNLDLPRVEPSKRTILSTVSKIYDPLGFISPLVIKLKKFIQDLWKLGLDWDEPVPNELKLNWEVLLSELPTISHLRIPRFICGGEFPTYQIVGFSDASETAYCGALYLRVITREGIKSYLLTAKTRLAPLKTLTIPRLELCGCLLLTRLYQSIAEFLDLLKEHDFIAPRYFTDSTIVLSWLQTPPYKLRTFVCNRVNEILQTTTQDQWHHVASSDNPADLGSRGVLPQELLVNKLWWSGPVWLSQPSTVWNLRTPTITRSDLPEIKPEKSTLISVKPSSLLQAEFIVSLITKFSSFNRLLRTLAYALRFVRNLKNEEMRSTGPLTLGELRSAQMICVTAVQRQVIFENDLTEKGQAKVFKKFVKLNPFFDSLGILRAGGRLYNANLPYNQKHPVLLPPNCHLTTLIIDHFHRVYLHPGPSLLQAVVQLEFWIPSLRKLVRKRIFNCSRCYRLKAKTFIPKMADLPPHRVRPTRAFLKTGVDFAGPFMMRESRRRKAPFSKVYLCVFICMATKAIHIEVVTSLTADGFLAALDRFVSIRGLPEDLFSDCGSNFVSAARQLKEWYMWFTNEEVQGEIADKATVRQINWHFNPPYAPHFGGIWEGGVKSAKSLMTRTIGDATLTYEELATLVAKITAVLNSRPLTPLSDDPSESEYLSPGHFLIGEAPLAIPEPSLLDVSINRLDRWQLIKRMSQYFWDRWSKEYLSTLQMRNKWTEDSASLKVGDLVFLKNDNQPILQWARGRITQVHPGKDGKVRVATVKTATSTFNRPVAQLIPLFPPEDQEPTAYDPPEEEKRRYTSWIRGSKGKSQDWADEQEEVKST